MTGLCKSLSSLQVRDNKGDPGERRMDQTRLRSFKSEVDIEEIVKQRTEEIFRVGSNLHGGRSCFKPFFAEEMRRAFVTLAVREGLVWVRREGQVFIRDLLMQADCRAV